MKQVLLVFAAISALLFGPTSPAFSIENELRFGGQVDYAIPLPEGNWQMAVDHTAPISDQAINFKTIYLVQEAAGDVTGIVLISATLDLAKLSRSYVSSLCQERRGRYVQEEQSPARGGEWCWTLTPTRLQKPKSPHSPTMKLFDWLQMKGYAHKGRFYSVRFVRFSNEHAVFITYMFPRNGQGRLSRDEAMQWARDWAPKIGDGRVKR